MRPAEERLSTHLGDIAFLRSGPSSGRQPPLVLLHGFLATKEFWLPLLAHLPSQLPVLAPDLWPLARLRNQEKELDFDFMVEVVEALRLQLRLPSLRLAGQDLGNLILLRYLHRFPHAVSQCVLQSPALYPDQELPRELRRWRRGLTGSYLSGRGFPRALRNHYSRGARQALALDAAMAGPLQAFGTPGGRARLRPWVHWGEPRLLFWEHPQMLRRVAAPCLILYGEGDPYVHYSQVERLGHHLDPQLARIVYLANCGHFPSLEMPERVGRELGLFLTAA